MLHVLRICSCQTTRPKADRARRSPLTEASQSPTGALKAPRGEDGIARGTVETPRVLDPSRSAFMRSSTSRVPILLLRRCRMGSSGGDGCAGRGKYAVRERETKMSTAVEGEDE
jgi:hypothetical protein